MTTGDVDIGLNGQPERRLSAPLPVIRVDDLEAAFDAVSKAGGMIAKPIFAFPGGRRFHFIDPAGKRARRVAIGRRVSRPIPRSSGRSCS